MLGVKLQIVVFFDKDRWVARVHRRGADSFIQGEGKTEREAVDQCLDRALILGPPVYAA
jgi:hypothetical protein